MSERATYRQFLLRAGRAELMCWLKSVPSLTVGRRLSLRDDARVWTIVERYATRLDAPPLKDWKVGGLV